MDRNVKDNETCRDPDLYDVTHEQEVWNAIKIKLIFGYWKVTVISLQLKGQFKYLRRI